MCAREGGSCTVPQGQICTIKYGIDSRWTERTNVKGTISCNNGVYGDPAVGTLKVCYYKDCVVWDGCAAEGEICGIPAGKQCSVQYGINGRFSTRPYVQSAIGCNNGVFGDPHVGTLKLCKLFDCQDADVACSEEGGVCQLPAGQTCSIRYGVDTRWNTKPLLTEGIGCNNCIFGDPAVGTLKKCFYFGCQNPVDPTFAITGVLFDATTNQRIPLNIVKDGNADVTYTELSGSGRNFKAVVSNGSWSIQLPDGNYRRTVSLNGYSTRTTEVLVNGNGEPFPTIESFFLPLSTDGELS
jgi:hypothetical protein